MPFSHWVISPLDKLLKFCLNQDFHLFPFGFSNFLICTVRRGEYFLFLDKSSLIVWWADEIRPYIFFIYLHPTPPTKCKTHQIWATLNCISGFFVFFFSFFPPKNQNCTEIVQICPPGAQLDKFIPLSGRAIKQKYSPLESFLVPMVVKIFFPRPHPHI